MKSILQPKLVNDPLGDPGLYVAFQHQKRALLFDLGEIHRLSPGHLLKVSDVFVTHTHMDHFIGFDRLLRVVFGRGMTLRIYGPVNFLNNVEGKLAGFTWNLVDRYEESVNLEVTEVREDRLLQATFRAIDRFERSGERELPFDGSTLLDEPGFRVRTGILEHRVPCLGFTVEEKAHININRDRLETMGLSPGPWLQQLKQSVLKNSGGEDEKLRVLVCDAKGRRQEEFRMGDLVRELVMVTRGRKIAYVTDTVYNDENKKRVVDLVRGADLFFCESPFLAEEADRALERCHLTSRQAGLLAREAGVQHLKLFHFSSRNTHQTDRLVREGLEAFHGR
ncbi:MAG: ribonuclease Z [Nitrospinaceae bacterium]